ncbi:unnamed protein product [Dovyalis caffra]|uniref:Uncharacterized protein n=1 Tax=Dovyalis caffra TaxID=77055 RepID=A0AAV1SMX0_9ROSI|nr:unnamed protein product [Dovyalis caffra]
MEKMKILISLSREGGDLLLKEKIQWGRFVVEGEDSKEGGDLLLREKIQGGRFVVEGEDSREEGLFIVEGEEMKNLNFFFRRWRLFVEGEDGAASEGKIT